MTSFFSSDEQALCNEFLEKGIVKVQVEDINALNEIADRLDSLSPLNDYHKNNADDLNDERIKFIRLINSLSDVRLAYYSLARNALNTLVGNELVMQRNINLSIQLPGDESSLLPIHTDVLQGDSPYEVVLWVPLVDCYGTKSMFFCDKKASDEALARLGDFKDTQALYDYLKPHLQFMDVKYGECLIFSPTIFHGNVRNDTDETRWSLNCRFKSALSPYADKKLGEFFEPITLRPVTRMGMRYAAV